MSELAICSHHDYRVIREISKEEKKKYIYIYIQVCFPPFLQIHSFCNIELISTFIISKSSKKLNSNAKSYNLYE